MGLLDDLFGKETIQKLKKQLSEKVVDISRAESKIAEEKVKLTELENQLYEIKALVVDREVVVESLKSVIDEIQLNNSLQLSELEKLRVSSSVKEVKTENIISNLKVLIADAKAETLAALNARESIERVWIEERESFEVKDHFFKEREANLAKKSEKLLKDRQKFQQQSSELHLKEQRWKHNIEPKLQKYEAHLSLDIRELKLQELNIQLEQLRISLEERG